MDNTKLSGAIIRNYMSIFTNNQITSQTCLEELISYDSDFMREWVAQRIANGVTRAPLKLVFGIKDNTFIDRDMFVSWFFSNEAHIQTWFPDVTAFRAPSAGVHCANAGTRSFFDQFKHIDVGSLYVSGASEISDTIIHTTPDTLKSYNVILYDVRKITDSKIDCNSLKIVADTLPVFDRVSFPCSHGKITINLPDLEAIKQHTVLYHFLKKVFELLKTNDYHSSEYFIKKRLPKSIDPLSLFQNSEIMADTIDISILDIIHFKFLLRPWTNTNESNWWLNAYKEVQS